MALKVSVPADFGLENLYLPRHGNIVIKLQNDGEMPANSLILSYNSAVFVNMFNILGLGAVEMEDFSTESVVVFLEALYTGEVELKRALFREVNKLASVFKVTWLIQKCRDYFSHVAQHLQEEDFVGLCFMFDEARYVKDALKNDNYLNIVVETMSELVDVDSVFIEKYMKLSFSNLSNSLIDIMLQIAGERVLIFLKIIKDNYMSTPGMVLDDNMRYLLQQVDLVKCMEQDMKLYEEILDFLLANMSNMADMQMIVKLNMEATKTYRTKGTPPNEVPAPAGVPLTASKSLPNLFHSKAQFPRSGLDQMLSYLSNSSDVKSLYMAIEAIDICYLWTDFTKETLQKLIKIKQKRGWNNIHPDFIDRLLLLSTDVSANPMITMIKNCVELVSDTTSIQIVAETTTTFTDLVFTEKKYNFFFVHPYLNFVSCSNPTQCGFVVQVSALVKDDPNFNIELVTDPAVYPNNLHCHSGGISTQNMHMTIEMCNQFSQQWFNFGTGSWYGRPEFRDWGMAWGSFGEATRSKCRLVVYYSLDNYFSRPTSQSDGPRRGGRPTRRAVYRGRRRAPAGRETPSQKTAKKE